MARGYARFCKRCSEIAVLGGAGSAEDHRVTLSGYTGDLLTHLITLSAAVAIVSFLQYATSVRTASAIGTIYLVYTVPFVIYGVFRFAMLSMMGRFGDPVGILVHDWPLQVTAVVWIASVLAVIRWGVGLQNWLSGG